VTATLRVPVRRSEAARGLDLPRYATDGSAGLDLLAAVEQDQVLKPGERALIPTGLSIALPPGYEAQVRPRSGLALRHGLAMVNAPGTIDSDYRGEIGVLLINLGDAPFTVVRGARIAQLVVAPVIRIEWEASEGLCSTGRGAGGFGHTGE